MAERYQVSFASLRIWNEGIVERWNTDFLEDGEVRSNSCLEIVPFIINKL